MPALRGSRYEFAPVEIDDQGRPFLDVPAPIKVPPSRDETRPLVDGGDTLGRLAWVAYKAVRDRRQGIRPSGFFWVVGMVNEQLDGFAPLPAGERFRIPSVSTLLEDILAPPAFFSKDEVL